MSKQASKHIKVFFYYMVTGSSGNALIGEWDEKPLTFATGKLGGGRHNGLTCYGRVKALGCPVLGMVLLINCLVRIESFGCD